MSNTLILEGKEYTKEAAGHWVSDYQLHLEWLRDQPVIDETAVNETISNINKFYNLYISF